MEVYHLAPHFLSALFSLKNFTDKDSRLNERKGSLVAYLTKKIELLFREDILDQDNLPGPLALVQV